MKRKITLLIFLTALVSLGTASNFQISSLDYNDALEENETLEIEASIDNIGTSGLQTVRLMKSGSEVSVQDLQLDDAEEGTVNLNYEIESGDALEGPEFKVETANDTEKLNLDIATLEKKFNQGWNYFSLPIATQSNPQIDSVLPEGKIKAVWRFEDGNWESYSPEAPSNAFNSFKGGEGYIIKADESFTVRPSVENTMDVDEVQNSNPSSEDLQQGWNLIGHYWEEKQNSGENYALDTLPEDSVGGAYQQASGGDLSLNKLENKFNPGEAYWQFVNTNMAYGKSDNDPTTPNYCCDSGYAVKKVPGISDGTDSSVIKNNSLTLRLQFNHYYFSSEDYLNETELEEKTITNVYISNNSTDDSKDYDSSKFSKVCEEDTKLDDEDKFNCNLDTENLSYGEYSVYWNVTRKDGYHWQSESRKNIKITSKWVPNFNEQFKDFYGSYNDRFLIDNQTGKIVFDKSGFDSEKYLNNTELESKTRTKVYVSDFEPNSSSDYSSTNFEKICDMKTALTDDKIKCNISAENLSSGEKWLSYNVSRNDDLSWQSRVKSFRVLKNDFKPSKNYSIKNYTLRINEINSIDSQDSFNFYGNFDTTVNFTLYSNNEDEGISTYGIDAYGSNRNIIGSESYGGSMLVEDAIKFNEGKATVKKRLETDEEAKYLLIKDEDKEIRFMVNLTDEIFGSLPDLTPQIGPKFTDETVTLNQGVNINLSYNGDSSSGDLTKREFIETSNVSINVVNRTEVYRKTGESIYTRDLEDNREEYKRFERSVCKNVEPSDGWINCTLSESELEAGRDYLITWEINNEKGQEKTGVSSFNAIRMLQEGQLAENSEVKVNISDVFVSGSSDGWKEFEMSSYLHNKNMTYSDNNATSVDFNLLNSDKASIASDSGDARLYGPRSVRKGYNETDDYMQETIVDSSEPNYLLAGVDYGKLGGTFSFAFEIDRSDLK